MNRSLRLSLLLTLCLLHGFSYGHDRTKIYVDASYTGSVELGTTAQPFRTIPAALNQRVINGLANMTTDEEIIVKAGVYIPNTLIRVVSSNGGTDAHWFTLRAEGEVIVDGDSIFDEKYAALMQVTEGAQHVRIQGFKLRNMRNNLALTSVNANGDTLRDTKFGLQVSANCKHVEIVNNELYDMSWTLAVDPMKDKDTFTAADIAEMKKAKGSNNLGGISVVGSDAAGLEDIKIIGNHLHNIIPGYTEAVAVNGYVKGFEVSNNVIHDIQNIGIVAAGNYPWILQNSNFPNPPSAADNYARDGLIKNNTVYRCSSPIAAAAGIYCDGSRNVVIESNLVYECQYGFSAGNEVEASSSGGHTFRNNIAYGNAYAGIVMGVGDNKNGSFIDSVMVTNNTFYKNGKGQDIFLPTSGQSEITIQKDIKNVTIQNNVVYSNSNRFVVLNTPFSAENASFLNTIAFDYNLYYTEFADPSNPQIFDWSQQNAFGYDFYGSFAYYRTQLTTQDVHSSFSDPQFVNAAGATPDFHLTQASPAVNAGIPTPGAVVGTTDFGGNARIVSDRIDIGAYESTYAGGTGNTGDVAATLDGQKSIGENYVALITGVNQGVFTSMYAYDDADYVYLYAEYSGAMSEYSIYLNKNSTTGYAYWWTDLSDYYIDGSYNVLNEYSATAPNPAFPFVAPSSSAGIIFVKTATTIEGRIPKSRIGIGNSGSMGIGIEGYSTNWASSVGTIPVSGSMVYVTLDGGETVNEGQIDGVKSTSEAYVALMTGVTQGVFRNIYGYDDDSYIYIYAETEGNFSKYAAFLNTDGATGYAHVWNDLSNFYVDGNYNLLNQYSATADPDWPFIEAASSQGIEFIKTAGTIEGKIPKTLLGLGNSGTAGIGLEAYSAGWNTSLGAIPVSGSMVYLTLDGGFSARMAEVGSKNLSSSSSENTLAKEEDAGFNVFPSPVTTGPLTIRYTTSSDSPTLLEVLGMDGKKYISRTLNIRPGNHIEVLPVDNLPQGIAIVRVIQSGVVMTRKVIISHP